MRDPIFKLDDWEPLFPIDRDTAVDANGHFKVRMGDNMALDPDTGEMDFTTPWQSGGGGFTDDDF